MNSLNQELTDLFGEVVYSYPLEQALEDGMLIRVGVIKETGIPIIFTSNLFSEVQETFQGIILKGLALLAEPDPEDSEFMKLRVIEKGKIWVVLNSEGCIFMMPEEY